MTDDRDVVLRLREPRHDGYEPCLVDQRAMRDAADEIERLREQLRYFGELAKQDHDQLTAEIERLRNVPL